MMSREPMASLLLGALAGSLVAGRFASATGCLVLAGTCAVVAGARRPRASALRLVGVGTAVALVLNTLRVPGGHWARCRTRASRASGWERS